MPSEPPNLTISVCSLKLVKLRNMQYQHEQNHISSELQNSLNEVARDQHYGKLTITHNAFEKIFVSKLNNHTK